MSCQRVNKNCPTLRGPAVPVIETRRDFLRGVVRYVAAGGLVGGIGLLVLGEANQSSADDDCVKAITCGGCDAFGACDLPRAMAAKQRIGNYNARG